MLYLNQSSRVKFQTKGQDLPTWKTSSSDSAESSSTRRAFFFGGAPIAIDGEGKVMVKAVSSNLGVA